MSIQTENGKAFEYACLNSLHSNLINQQQITIVQTNSVNIAINYYNGLSPDIRSRMDLAANAAIRVILRLEPQLQNPLDNIPLYLSIQEDATGITGDVRDVLFIRQQNGWEIGISCKHNHSGVKHSRLSRTIDFGQSWFGIPCSHNYFNIINPMFDQLEEMRTNGLLWRNVQNKEHRFYIPLLHAFINELTNLDTLNPGIIPTRLMEYLLGRNDFYKIITLDRRRTTQLQAYNIHGTLNRQAGNIRPLTPVQQLVMPTRFYNIAFKQGSSNTIEIVCDQGWTVSLRIHNASSRVEPSLKFDVTLKGIPPALYTHYESWD